MLVPKYRIKHVSDINLTHQMVLYWREESAGDPSLITGPEILML